MRLNQTLRPAFRLSLLAGFGLVLGVAAACSGQATSSNVAPEVGHHAPSFEAHFVGGDTARLDDLLEKGVILNFWATWCGPCKRELPLLEHTAREHTSDGVTVIGINMGEPEEDVQDFLEEFTLTFPIALDTDGGIARLYAVPALPMTFFIDGNGVIQYRRAGELREGHITEGLSRIASRTQG